MIFLCVIVVSGVTYYKKMNLLSFPEKETVEYAEISYGISDEDPIYRITDEEKIAELFELVDMESWKKTNNMMEYSPLEIPGMDITVRPCYYKGSGRIKGSYTRVGDSDEPMTEYEVYSYEAYRKKYQDDIRPVARGTIASLDQNALSNYIGLLKQGKSRLEKLSDETIYELMSVVRNGEVTLSSIMLFSPYPQAYFPQLCIIAIVVPGKELGTQTAGEERFLDNQRIEGTIPEMLQEAIQFVKRNMKTRTIIDSKTGKREDRTDYPILAIREAIINALVHRDYSIHSEGMPIQLIMFEDRLEIHNPGGIYGRIRIDQLGKVQPDTRNPVWHLPWKSWMLQRIVIQEFRQFVWK